jgi:hypothetical protein
MGVLLGLVKVTLYVPEEDQAFIEEIVRSQRGKSFSRLVIDALKEKFGRKKTKVLFGSLNRYRKPVSDKEIISKTMEMIAENAAKESISH